MPKTGKINRERWYYFEVHRSGFQRMYLGKCFTDLAEIRKSLPWSVVKGNLVIVFGRVLPLKSKGAI